MKQPRTILITGAAGNLGSLLVRHPIAQGHPLRLMYHRKPTIATLLGIDRPSLRFYLSRGLVGASKDPIDESCADWAEIAPHLLERQPAIDAPLQRTDWSD